MYILDMNLLRKGDVILTAERAWLSKGVRLSTLGRFSHATIYLGGGSYIHSDGKGVHADNIQRLLFKSKRHVAVLRPNQPAYIEAACLFARTQVGKEYSVKEAVRTKKNLFVAKESNRQFCSRLVAQAYATAGLNISSNVDYCTPKKIHKSNKFYEIKKCIRKATKPEIEFADEHNPLHEQRRITNEILDFSRSITNADIQTFEQLTDFIIRNPEFDNEISTFMENSGYFDMWRYEYEKNKWRYNYHELVASHFSEQQKVEQCRLEIVNSQERKRLYTHNFVQYQAILNSNKLRYFELHVELYSNLVRITQENILTCSMYLGSKT